MIGIIAISDHYDQLIVFGPFWWLGDAFDILILCPFDGQVGLLTGFSVLSVMELLYHLGLLATAISKRAFNVN